MLKKPELQQQELELVSIEGLVPEKHLLRKVDRAVDFGFIRDRVKHLYCEDNGRPANVAHRWFLGLRPRDKVADASTLSQSRRRRFAESTIYQEIFDEIVLLAVNKGLASGAVLYTDSTHLKANANKNKLDLAEVAVKPQEYLAALDAAVTEDRAVHGKAPLKEAPAAEGKRIYKRRKETVERSFADAKQLHGHRYSRMCGLSKVQQQCLLAATAQNIKKIALLLSRMEPNTLPGHLVGAAGRLSRSTPPIPGPRTSSFAPRLNRTQTKQTPPKMMGFVSSLTAAEFSAAFLILHPIRSFLAGCRNSL